MPQENITASIYLIFEPYV